MRRAKKPSVKCFPVNFVPTSQRNPPKSGHYLCVLNGYMTTLSYSAKHNLWNYQDDYNPETDKMWIDDVRAWAVCQYIVDAYKEVPHE